MSDYVMDCADLEPCTLWEAKKVKARTPKKCNECGHPIVPGETYHRFKCLFEGDWSTWATCLCCEAARCAVAEAYSEGQYRACIPPGDLWAAVRDGLREGWLKREALGDVPASFLKGLEDE